jgi:hypothetical protein
LGFQVLDNGIGFNDENLASFKLMASKQKAARGGKGIGRFTWLKAFDDVRISSVYEDVNGKKKRREIEFSLQHGIKESTPVDVEAGTPIQTIVSLNQFKPAYRDLPAAYRTTEKIAQRILEHCLVSFLANKVPDIVVVDDPNENLCSLTKMFNDDIKPQITTDGIDVGKERFVLTELKLYGTNAQMHRMVFCADSREEAAQTTSAAENDRDSCGGGDSADRDGGSCCGRQREAAAGHDGAVPRRCGEFGAAGGLSSGAGC